MTFLFRRYDLEPTLAEDSMPIEARIATLLARNVDQDDRDFYRRMFRGTLAILGISITVPALEVLLSLWLF